MLVITLLIFLQSSQFVLNTGPKMVKCKHWLKKHLLLQKNYTILQNFDSFNELTNSKCSHAYNMSTLLEFLPRTSNKLIINKSLDIRRLVGRNNLYGIIMLDFKGIQIDFLNASTKLVRKEAKLASDLLISFSRLDFYVNEYSALTRDQCTSVYFNRTLYMLFEASFSKIAFLNVKYPAYVCTYALKSLLTRHLHFGSISNSLLSQNRLRFLEIAEESVADTRFG